MSAIFPGSRTEYPVSYVDDCDIDFKDPVPGSTMSVQNFGGTLDSLTRAYVVRTDRARAVETQLGRIKGKKDFQYQGLSLTEWTKREVGALTTFDCTFKGCFNNELPTSTISGGIDKQSVTLQYVAGSQALASLQGSTATVIYKSPFVTVRYVSREIPTELRFPRTNPAGKLEEDEIKGAQVGNIFIGGKTALAITNGGGTLTVPEAGWFPAFRTIEGIGPFYNQIGQYYECNETYREVLRPLGQDSRITFQST
jgi:hypothetical protein